MSHIFSRSTTTRRRLGVVVLTGAAAGLITLAAAPGSASASPDVLYFPDKPSISRDAAALNPQPLPPRGDEVALNPQPLPPRDLFSRVTLNPQPLPPGPGPNWSRILLPGGGF